MPTLRTKSLLGFALAAACTLSAHAQEGAVSKGSVFLPPRSSNAFVTIEGPGAITLYKAMSAKAIRDACRDNGSTIKTAGNLSCSITANGKAAVCDVGVNVKTGRSSPQRPC